MKCCYFQNLLLLQSRTIHNTKLQCTRCKSQFPVASGFYKNKTTKSGFDTSCKSCREDVKYQWRSTPHGFLTKLVHAAKSRHNKRYRKKGLEAPFFELTKEYLQFLYEKQNGLGFYSHIPLALQPFSHWTASLERLDPNRDYVHDNVVFDACEFNHRCQWNTGKVMQIPSLILAPSKATIPDINHAKVLPQRKESRKGLTQNNTYYCYDCHKWRETELFYPMNRIRCRSCFVQYVLACNNTLRGFMNRLWRNAKYSSKLKVSSG
eukprot:714797_1